MAKKLSPQIAVRVRAVGGVIASVRSLQSAVTGHSRWRREKCRIGGYTTIMSWSYCRVMHNARCTITQAWHRLLMDLTGDVSDGMAPLKDNYGVHYEDFDNI
jgi:hypothetical protein